MNREWMSDVIQTEPGKGLTYRAYGRMVASLYSNRCDLLEWRGHTHPVVQEMLVDIDSKLRQLGADYFFINVPHNRALVRLS